MIRFLAWLSGSVILLGLALGLLTRFIDSESLLEKIASVTEAASGAPLRLAVPPKLSFFPPGVKFAKASWEGELGAYKVSLSLASGRADLDLKALLGGTLRIGELVLEKPLLSVGRQAAKANQDGAKAQSPRPSAAAPDAAPSDKLPLELDRLLIQDARLNLSLEGENIALDGLKLSMENLRRREEASLQCDFGLALTQDKKELLSGNMAIKAKLRYYAPNLTLRQASITFNPLSGPVPAYAAPLYASLEGAANLADLSLKLAFLRLLSPLGRLDFSGSLALRPELGLVGQLELESSRLKLAPILGPMQPKDQILSLKTEISATAQKLKLGKLALEIGQGKGQGDLAMALGPKPSLSGQLDFSSLDLEPWLAPKDGPAQDPAPKARSAQASAAKSAAKEENVLAAKAWDLNLALKFAALRIAKLRFENLEAKISGKNGDLRLDPLRFGLAGGQVQAVITARLASYAWTLAASANNLGIASLLASLGKPGEAGGELAFSLNLRALGQEKKEIFASLNGTGLIDLSDLSLAALKALNDKVPSFGRGPLLPEKFTLVRMPFESQKGEIRSRKLSAQATGLTASGNLHLSLPREYLEGAVNVRTLGLDVPLLFEGPLAQISLKLDPKFIFSLGKDVSGGLLKGLKESEKAAGAGGEKAEDAVKRGARGLIRGLLRP